MTDINPRNGNRVMVKTNDLNVLDDALNHYIACQRFYNAAVSTLYESEVYAEDKDIAQGMAYTSYWLNQQGEKLQSQLEYLMSPPKGGEIKEPVRLYPSSGVV